MLVAALTAAMCPFSVAYKATADRGGLIVKASLLKWEALRSSRRSNSSSLCSNGAWVRRANGQRMREGAAKDQRM